MAYAYTFSYGDRRECKMFREYYWWINIAMQEFYVIENKRWSWTLTWVPDMETA